uniref:PDZ and LIM domain protein Zasp n=1 Tax=Macrostomum lignano TaxID=282301 RepID=A0A1I8HUK8_9PLAT
VRMTRPDSGTPWGFRLQGGRDFNSALTIQKVSKGGMAERHGVCVGDRVVSIGGDPTHNWTHQQAQQAVIRCGNELDLGLASGGGGFNHAYFQPQPQQHQFQPAAAPYSPPARQTAGNSSGATRLPAANAITSLSLTLYSITLRRHSSSRHSSSRHSHSSFSPQQFSPPQQFLAAELFSACSTAAAAPPAPAPRSAAPLMSSVGGGGGSAGLSGRSRRGEAQRQTQQAAGGVPVCSVCGSVIRGPFLVALDKCFCPDHFNCSVCGRNLEPCGFVEEANQLYCEDDYVRLLAPRCGSCQQTIVSESVHAMDQYFHRQCFVCAHCRQSIAGGSSELRTTGPTARRTGATCFFTKCAKCHEAIAPIDRFVEVLGGTYHAECFCCAVCGTCLEGKPFAPKDGKAYCKLHARRF